MVKRGFGLLRGAGAVAKGRQNLVGSQPLPNVPARRGGLVSGEDALVWLNLGCWSKLGHWSNL
ncbi:hypothetical protein T484DRAFT_2288290 [Baffinella frigidus]|nr:hypothetical protein T484DRAFT_2288290 [Cryptophyta sp. CCMP2293]